MKTLIMGLLLMGMASAQAAEPPQRSQDAQSFRQQVANQLNKLSLSGEDLSKRLVSDIRGKYGFDVSCNNGWWGYWGGLDTGSCYMGLETLDSALADVNPLIDRTKLDSIHIEVAQTGVWQRITFDDKEMKVPFNANRDRMAKFINDQMKVLFGTSIADMDRMNHEAVAQIRSHYFFNVEPTSSLQSVEFHDGLRRLAVALQLVYGGARPSPQEAKTFGFDTVVLGSVSKSLFEDNGHLKLQLASNERPGEMLVQMLHQVHGQPGYLGRLKQMAPMLFSTGYTWPQIQKFDLTRSRVHSLMQWSNAHIPNTAVGCILDRGQSRSVTLDECREGLESLQAAFVKHGIPKEGLPVSKILIGDTFLGRTYMNHQGVLTVNYSIQPESLYEVATRR